MWRIVGIVAIWTGLCAGGAIGTELFALPRVEGKSRHQVLLDPRSGAYKIHVLTDGERYVCLRLLGRAEDHSLMFEVYFPDCSYTTEHGGGHYEGPSTIVKWLNENGVATTGSTIEKQIVELAGVISNVRQGHDLISASAELELFTASQFTQRSAQPQMVAQVVNGALWLGLWFAGLVLLYRRGSLRRIVTRGLSVHEGCK